MRSRGVWSLVWASIIFFAAAMAHGRAVEDIERQIIPRESKCPIGQTENKFGKCVDCEDLGKIWSDKTASCVCEPCTREVAGECRWCYQDEMACVNGQCVATVTATDSGSRKPPEERGSTGTRPHSETSPLVDDFSSGGGQQPDRVIVDDFSQRWNQNPDQVIDDRDISRILIIRELVPVIEQILIPVIIERGGSVSTSSSSTNSSTTTTYTQTQRTGINKNLADTGKNVTIINQTINNNLLDIKKLDAQINFFKNKGNLTVAQKVSLEKLIAIKKEREGCQKKLSEKDKSTRSDYRNLVNQKREIARVDQDNQRKQEEFNQQKEHQRKQEEYNKRAENERRQKEFNNQKERERRERERAEHEKRQKEYDKRQEEERVKAQQEKDRYVPPPVSQPRETPSGDSECVNGIRVNSSAWRSLNNVQQQNQLGLKAQWDAHNRNYPDRFKPYPPQWLQWFCQ